MPAFGRPLGPWLRGRSAGGRSSRSLPRPLVRPLGPGRRASFAGGLRLRPLGPRCGSLLRRSGRLGPVHRLRPGPGGGPFRPGAWTAFGRAGSGSRSLGAGGAAARCVVARAPAAGFASGLEAEPEATVLATRRHRPARSRRTNARGRQALESLAIGHGRLGEIENGSSHADRDQRRVLCPLDRIALGVSRHASLRARRDRA